MTTNNSENQDLQQRLEKGIAAFDLRDTLTKFGIPKNEKVVVSFKRGNEILANCEIEGNGGNGGSQKAEMSLESESFSSEILKFLMETEETYDLSEAVPNLDRTAEEKIQFRLDFSSTARETFGACFYYSCVNCPNNQQCCWKRC